MLDISRDEKCKCVTHLWAGYYCTYVHSNRTVAIHIKPVWNWRVIQTLKMAISCFTIKGLSCIVVLLLQWRFFSQFRQLLACPVEEQVQFTITFFIPFFL